MDSPWLSATGAKATHRSPSRRELPVCRLLEHLLTCRFEHIFDLQSGLGHEPGQGFGIGSVFPLSVCCDLSRSSCKGDQRSRWSVDLSEPTSEGSSTPLDGALSKRVVAARVENHDVHATFAACHLGQGFVDGDSSDRDILHTLDLGPRGDHVVGAIDLDSVACEVEKSDAASDFVAKLL